MSAIATPSTSVEQYSMFIDGEFVSFPTMLPVLNPATEEIISEVPAATADHVDAAVLAAERAQPEWARLPAIRRAQCRSE